MVVVPPPKEFVEQERAAGRPTNILWRLKKILPGRRRRRQSWMNHLLKVMEQVGIKRCDAAPQLYKGDAQGRRMSVVVEAHMDDMNGGG